MSAQIWLISGSINMNFYHSNIFLKCLYKHKPTSSTHTTGVDTDGDPLYLEMTHGVSPLEQKVYSSVSMPVKHRNTYMYTPSAKKKHKLCSLSSFQSKQGWVFLFHFQLFILFSSRFSIISCHNFISTMHKHLVLCLGFIVRKFRY